MGTKADSEGYFVTFQVDKSSLEENFAFKTEEVQGVRLEHLIVINRALGCHRVEHIEGMGLNVCLFKVCSTEEEDEGILFARRVAACISANRAAATLRYPRQPRRLLAMLSAI